MEDTVDLLKIKIEKAKRDLPLQTINAINAVDYKIAILGMRTKHGYTFEQLGNLELETELLLCGLVTPEDYPKELSKRMGIGKAAADQLVNEMNDLVFKKIREELVKNFERKKVFTGNTIPATSGGSVIKKENGFKSWDTGNTNLGVNKVSPFEILSKSIKDERAQLKRDGIEIVDKQTPEAPKVAALPDRDTMLERLESSALVNSNIPALNALELGPGHPSEPSEKSNIPLKPTPKVEEVHPMLAEKLAAPVQIPTIKTDHSLENLTKPDVVEPPAASAVPQNIPVPPDGYPPKADPYRLSPDE